MLFDRYLSAGVYLAISLAVSLAAFCLPMGLHAQVDPVDIEMDATTRNAAADTLSQRVEQPEDTLQRANLVLTARNYGDSLVLRWGMTDYPSWKAASEVGYIIERRRLRLGADSTVWETVNSAPIKPLSIDEWRAGFAPEDSLAGAAVQTLYGRAITTTNDRFGSIYQMHLQQENFVGFALMLADLRTDLADGLALRYVDRSMEPGAGYLYRIRAAGAPRSPVDTALTLVSPEPFSDFRSIKSLRAHESEKLVVLTWDRQEHPDMSFSSYIIERSFDGGVTFEKMNTNPFVSAVDKRQDNGSNAENTNEFRIELEKNYEPVSYRVRALDAFGESTRGDTVIVAMGRDITAPSQPRIQPAQIVDGRSALISWEIDPTKIDPDLAGFFVAKAPDPEGPFELVSEVLPETTRSFLEEDIVDLPQHYYLVGAVDTAGNSRLSAPILVMFPDSIPPAVPVNLTGEIDTLGRVKLTWSANQEFDLQGYRVFYAHQSDHEYQQLTTDILADTVFYDSLTVHTLSEEILYKVTALDQNFNHSGFTEPLLLKKPDLVPPAAAVINDVVVSDSAVNIAWQRSSSDDVEFHRMLRREQGAIEWMELIDIPAGAQGLHADTSAVRGTIYEYALQVYDDAGLTSPLSNIVSGRVYDSGVRSGVKSLNLVQDEKGAVTLSWEYSGDSNAQFYVYRAVGTSKPSLVRAVAANVRTFRDNEVSKGMKVRYAVKTVTADGGESALVASRDLELR